MRLGQTLIVVTTVSAGVWMSIFQVKIRVSNRERENKEYVK